MGSSDAESISSEASNNVGKHLELNFETRALGDTVGFSEVI
jgi:hypothetical protein